MKRLLSGLLPAIVLSTLVVGCASTAEPPLELSTARPSLLFFYTDN